MVFILGIISVIAGLNWRIIHYASQQGSGQLSVLTNTIDVSEMLNDPEVPDSIKLKLKQIQEIKDFAQDSLGLEPTGNYTSYYDQKGKPILWVVTACSSFRLEEYEWDYPVLGSLGYRGYFNKQKADGEAQRLSDLGYDVDVGEVNAWSTLGWFKDPVLSSMLDKSEGEMARLIIHELTHTTVYISNDSDFNENLATFVGDRGAGKYLKQKYGLNSKELVDYQKHISDLEKLADHFLIGTEQLRDLYFNMNELTTKQKVELKEQQIQLIIANLDTVGFSSVNKFQHLKLDSFRPNNTFFITYAMYRGDQDEMKKLFNGSLKRSYRAMIRYAQEL
jgi:predicted aminopeptidase